MISLMPMVQTPNDDADDGAEINGGRRPTVVAAPVSISPELPAGPRRRTFTAKDKPRILADVDRGTETGGIGAVSVTPVLGAHCLPASAVRRPPRPTRWPRRPPCYREPMPASPSAWPTPRRLSTSKKSRFLVGPGPRRKPFLNAGPSHRGLVATEPDVRFGGRACPCGRGWRTAVDAERAFIATPAAASA